MNDFAHESELLTAALAKLRTGDAAAREEIVRLTADRLSRLTRHVLRQYPGVRRWEETDDVAQNAALRLWQALATVKPAALADLLGFTSLQIRRELTDLARKYAGTEGLGANHASVGDRLYDSNIEPGGDTLDPAGIADWSDFHEAVERLPDDERAAVDLLWYQGLTQPDAANLLAVSESTLRRRWRAARVILYSQLSGEPMP